MAEKAKITDIEELDGLNTDNRPDKENLEELIEASFEEPTRPLSQGWVPDPKNKDYKFYLYVQSVAEEWWNEFNTTLDDKACPKYKSAFQFAKEKGRTLRERDLIYEMIGPRPEKKALRVPWLGDWKRRRVAGYNSPVLPSNIKKLAQACKDKLDAVEAIRSTGPYLVHELMMYSKMSEDITRAFNGMMFVENYAPDDPKNMARSKAYITLQKSITKMKLTLLENWFKVHGVSPEEPQLMIQINQQVLSNTVNGSQLENCSIREVETIKLARMLQRHAENFNMPLPADQKTLQGEVLPADKEKKQSKGSGKIQ